MEPIDNDLGAALLTGVFLGGMLWLMWLVLPPGKKEF